MAMQVVADQGSTAQPKQAAARETLRHSARAKIDSAGRPRVEVARYAEAKPS